MVGPFLMPEKGGNAHMADEKPKTLQEQSSPTGPPVSQEVKDTAPAVAQPGKEKDKTADTKSVEAKETEAAGSNKAGRYCKGSQRNPAETDRGQPCRSRQKTVRFYY